MGMSDEQFISEPIDPEPGSFNTDMMISGLASLPRAFTWRGRRYQVVECLEHAKESAPERGVADGERYLRRQVFTVRLDSGEVARLYVQRQPPRGASRQAAKKRWFLYSISPASAPS